MTPIPASSLGFVANLPAEFEVSRLTLYDDPVITSQRRVELVQDLIKQNSLLTVKVISEDLAQKAVDPATSTAQKLSILDAHMKLAGVDKKPPVEAARAGSGYQLTINIGAKSENFTATTIESEAV